jgi:hypothetical protein
MAQPDTMADVAALRRGNHHPVESVITTRGSGDHDGVAHAHYYDDYTEHLLTAEDTSLALKPAQMRPSLRTALRLSAIYGCDGDPIGAVNIAIQEAAEDLDARLPVLKSVALRLNEGIRRRTDAISE